MLNSENCCIIFTAGTPECLFLKLYGITTMPRFFFSEAQANIRLRFMTL